MNRHLKILSFMCMIIVTGVSAQDAEIRPDQRSRVAYVYGDVVMQPSTSGNTLEAVMNMPFMKGDRLATGADGIFEFRLGDGVTGWGWYETKIELLESIMEATDQRLSIIKLWYGAVAIRSFPMSYISHQMTLELEGGTLNPDSDSLVRVTMESDFSAVYVTLVKGGALLNTNEGQIRLEQEETWQGTLGTGKWTRIRSLRNDKFDDWYWERDRLLLDSYEYTDQVPVDAAPSEYTDQAAALHGYGKWIYIEGGWYWMPYVASGWMPYHAGFWDFILPWGWIWIPYEPWGWTVYHYGYWRFFAGRGWMWYPSWYWRGHYAHWRYNPGRSVHWIAAHPDDEMNSQGILRKGATPLNSRLAIGVPVEAAQTVDHLLNRVSVQRNANRLLSAENAEWGSSLPETLKPSMSRRQTSDHAIGESMQHPNNHRGTHPAVRGRPSQADRSVDIQPHHNPQTRERGVSRPSGPAGIQAPKPPYRYPEQPRSAPNIHQPDSRPRAPQTQAPPQRAPKQWAPKQQTPQQQAPQKQQAPKPQSDKSRGKQPSAPTKPKPPSNDGGLTENVSAGIFKTPTITGNVLVNLLKTGLSIGVKGKGAGALIGHNNAVTAPLSAN